MQPRFKLLGLLQVLIDGRACASPAPQARSVLTLLILRANRVVSMDSFAEELWGARPPRNAAGTVQTHICNLRKAFAAEAPGESGASLIETRSPGYLLRVAPEHIDITQFEALLRRGTALLDAARYDEAVLALRAGLDLWTGAPFTDVPRGMLLSGHAAQLEERRAIAVRARITADASLGRHAELIAELRTLVRADPLDEWLHEQLIAALGRAGRRGEALRAYQVIRDLLAEELGVDPSPALQRLQLEILSAGAPGVAGSASARIGKPAVQGV